MTDAPCRRRCWPPSSGWPCTRGPARCCSRPSVPTSAATSSPGMLASGMDRDKRTRLFIDVGTNCEIVLSDGDRILSTAAPAGPAFEGGAIRCGMRADDGAIEVVKLDPADGDGSTLGVIGDVEPQGPVRLGSRRRRGRAGEGRAARRQRPVRPRGGRQGDRARAGRPAHDPDPTGPGAGLRAAPADAATPTRPSAWCSPSATCASCSSPRPRSRPAGRCCSRSSASSTATCSRCCWPARSAATSPPRPRSGSVWSRSCRCCASSRPATSPARARRWRCCRSASGPAPLALLEEVTYVELSDRPEFNDRFVDQLAFDGLTSTVALIACGAMAQPAAEIVERRGWPVAVHPLPPLLHNQPQLIAGEVRAPGHRRSPRRYDDGRRRLRRLRDLRRPRRGLRRARAAPAARAALLRPVRRRVPAGGVPRRAARDLPASPTSWCAPSSAPWSASSAWTATPSCATTTSATTRGWSGWPRSRRRAARAWPRPPPPGSGLPLTVVETGDAPARGGARGAAQTVASRAGGGAAR